MKVGILGQGASGIFLALMLKFENEKVDVTIIDKNANPGRKFLATGNGRCNLGNLEIKDNSYNCEAVSQIVRDFDWTKQEEFFKNIGVLTRNIGNLVYPFSLSAKSLLDYLVDFAKQNKVKFVSNENLLDYELVNGKVKVTTSKKTFSFDKFVIACGNASGPQLGGSTSVLSILEKKSYKVVESRPGLCPVRVEENTKIVENQRVKCDVTLIIDKKETYKETGEVLFKKDGLSGIAIFNTSSIIARSSKFKKAIIRLDLFPDKTTDELYKELTLLNVISQKSLLSGIFTKEIAEFVRRNSGIKNLNTYTASELKKLALYLKNIDFTYKESYGFNDSQVSVGGVKLDCLTESLESKTEKNVFIIGEALNADGLCGGFNLMFAMASGHKALDEILKE